MCATGNVYFGNLTNQVEREGRLNILKSNLHQRVEELVEEDLRPLPTVLKTNRDKVCQSHDESQVQQLAEDLMAVTAAQTRHLYTLFKRGKKGGNCPVSSFKRQSMKTEKAFYNFVRV